MFYLTKLSKELSLKPQDLGIDIKNLISTKIKDLEGVVVGDNGYIIAILEFNHSGRGKVDNETGDVNYKIDYQAISFKPIKGEILQAIASIINEYGFFCNIGPLQIFVSEHTIGESWKFESEDNSWNASNSGNPKIVVGSVVTLKIIAIRINSNEISALGTIYA
jgi:DNA-directed RNA polymerase II subunit RPB7